MYKLINCLYFLCDATKKYYLGKSLVASSFPFGLIICCSRNFTFPVFGEKRREAGKKRMQRFILVVPNDYKDGEKISPINVVY